MKDFTNLIDRVIGKKGILRTPAWWVRWIFLQIQEAIDSLVQSVSRIKSDLEKTNKELQPYIIIESRSSTHIQIDGKSQNISQGIMEIPYENYFDISGANNIQWVDLRHAWITPQMEEYLGGVFECHTSQIYGLAEFLNTASTVVKPHISTSLIDSQQPFHLASLTDLSNMMILQDASVIDLANTDLSKVTDISAAFKGATVLNLPKFPKVEKAVQAFTSSRLLQIRANNTQWESLRDASYMFYGCNNLQVIEGLIFVKSPLENTQGMFRGCTNLKLSTPLSLNTASVTNMKEMFYGCNHIIVDFLSMTSTAPKKYLFSTTNVTDMSDMFSGFQGTTLNLYAPDTDDADGTVVFDTTNVTTVGSMFYNCSNLGKLYLGKKFFATKHLTFFSLSSLTQWKDVASVQLSLVTNLYDRKSAGLPTLTLSLSTGTYACLTDEDKTYIEEHGYKLRK